MTQIIDNTFQDTDIRPGDLFRADSGGYFILVQLTSPIDGCLSYVLIALSNGNRVSVAKSTIVEAMISVHNGGYTRVAKVDKAIITITSS